MTESSSTSAQAGVCYVKHLRKCLTVAWSARSNDWDTPEGGALDDQRGQQ
jgi:hypothetical protein